jgi:uncharacterized protein
VTKRYIDGGSGVARGRVPATQARHRANLTQAELARRAGLAQSVISAYESGRRQPALPTLAALTEATGLELSLQVLAPPVLLGRLSGPIGRIVRQRRSEVISTAAAHGVTNLRVFGSVARGQEHADSDVDLLADLPPNLGLIWLGRLEQELEALLGVRVEVIPRHDLKPDVRRRVEQEAVPL